MKKTLIALLLCARQTLSAQAALDPAQVRQLAAEDSSEKVAAIRQLTQTADPDAVRVLKAMAEDSLFLAGDKVVIIDGEQGFRRRPPAKRSRCRPTRRSSDGQ